MDDVICGNTLRGIKRKIKKENSNFIKLHNMSDDVSRIKRSSLSKSTDRGNDPTSEIISIADEAELIQRDKYLSMLGGDKPTKKQVTSKFLLPPIKGKKKTSHVDFIAISRKLKSKNK